MSFSKKGNQVFSIENIHIMKLIFDYKKKFLQKELFTLFIDFINHIKSIEQNNKRLNDFINIGYDLRLQNLFSNKKLFNNNEELYKSYVLFKYYDNIIENNVKLMIDCAYININVEISFCSEKYKFTNKYFNELQKWLFPGNIPEEVDNINLLNLKPQYNTDKIKPIYETLININKDIDIRINSEIEIMKNRFINKYNKLLYYLKICHIDKRTKEFEKDIKILRLELDSMTRV